MDILEYIPILLILGIIALAIAIRVGIWKERLKEAIAGLVIILLIKLVLKVFGWR